MSDTHPFTEPNTHAYEPTGEFPVIDLRGEYAHETETSFENYTFGEPETVTSLSIIDQIDGGPDSLADIYQDYDDSVLATEPGNTRLQVIDERPSRFGGSNAIGTIAIAGCLLIGIALIGWATYTLRTDDSGSTDGASDNLILPGGQNLNNDSALTSGSKTGGEFSIVEPDKWVGTTSSTEPDITVATKAPTTSTTVITTTIPEEETTTTSEPTTTTSEPEEETTTTTTTDPVMPAEDVNEGNPNNPAQ